MLVKFKIATVMARKLELKESFEIDGSQMGIMARGI